MLEQDPIMKLGYGIVAYRNLQYALLLLFTFFTLMNIPVILIYYSGEGYSENVRRTNGNEAYSLGNLGYSSV